MELSEVTRKHIIGVLSAYTGKTLTSDVLPKLADDLLESVLEATNKSIDIEEDIPQ